MIEKIHCNVCQDLLPLVKDGVASEESKALVLEHIQNCDECLKCWGNNPLTFEASLNYDEKSVTKNVKLVVTSWAISIVFLGLVVGVLIGQTDQSFALQAIVLPIVGVLSYVVLKKIWFLTPTLIFLGLFLSQAYQRYRDAFVDNFFSITFSDILLNFFTAILPVIGVLIYLLLKFAFSKEKDND